MPTRLRRAVSFSRGSIGPDRTRLEVWADPALTRNTERIVAEDDSARFEPSSENMPSEDNPRTGKITPPSVVATLRGLMTTLRVGT